MEIDHLDRNILTICYINVYVFYASLKKKALKSDKSPVTSCNVREKLLVETKMVE